MGPGSIRHRQELARHASHARPLQQHARHGCDACCGVCARFDDRITGLPMRCSRLEKIHIDIAPYLDQQEHPVDISATHADAGNVPRSPQVSSGGKKPGWVRPLWQKIANGRARNSLSVSKKKPRECHPPQFAGSRAVREYPRRTSTSHRGRPDTSAASSGFEEPNRWMTSAAAPWRPARQRAASSVAHPNSLGSTLPHSSCNDDAGNVDVGIQHELPSRSFILTTSYGMVGSGSQLLHGNRLSAFLFGTRCRFRQLRTPMAVSQSRPSSPAISTARARE